MSLASIVTQGFLPATDASLPQVILMGYGGEAEPPPEPPVVDTAPARYGPALTPGQRRRWYGDDEYESPQKREARRQAIERLKRIEIGLIESDATEEEKEELIEAKVDQKLPEIAVRPMGRQINTKEVVDKVVKSVAAEMKEELAIRKKERIEMEEEEREALSLLAGMLFTMK